MVKVLAQADDFSGAAEVGQQFTAHGFPAQITLGTAGAHLRDSPAGPGVVVIDTHSRSMSPAAAAIAVKGAVEGLGPEALVFKKTDSLWRGNVGAELSALAGLGCHVVLAGALPAMGRTVVGAKPFAAGLPLRASGLWGVESRPAPEHLGELLATGGNVRSAGLDEVRSSDLAARLEAVLPSGAPVIAVVDGETDADLAAVVDALDALGFSSGGRPVALAGTGQLAGLLARRLAEKTAHTAHLSTGGRPPAAAAPRRGAVLAVVGSASPAARRQVGHLAAEGFDVVGLRAHDGGPDDERRAAERVRGALARGRSVVLGVADSPLDPSRSASIVARLSRVAMEGQREARPDLILTGGETARAVLDALGIASLVPQTAVQHGAVVSAADDGRLVASKPGSFGDPLVLAQLYRAIQSSNHPEKQRRSA